MLRPPMAAAYGLAITLLSPSPDIVSLAPAPSPLAQLPVLCRTISDVSGCYLVVEHAGHVLPMGLPVDSRHSITG